MEVVSGGLVPVKESEKSAQRLPPVPPRTLPGRSSACGRACLRTGCSIRTSITLVGLSRQQLPDGSRLFQDRLVVARGDLEQIREHGLDLM